VIVDDEETERTSVVGPYSEGADLSLRCDVYGGKCATYTLCNTLMDTTWYLMRSAYSVCRLMSLVPLNKLRTENLSCPC